MKFPVSSVLVLSVLVATSFAHAGAKAKPQEEAEIPVTERPWDLRDHYKLTLGNMKLLYAADNAQWRLDQEGVGIILDKVDAAITLADGPVIPLTDMGDGDTTRAKVTRELGPGMEYVVKIPGRDGVSVRHSLTNHDTHPFYLVRIEVTNSSDKPISVKKISSALIGPNCVKNLTAETQVSSRKLGSIGSSPVVSNDTEPLYTIIRDKSKSISLGLGVLPLGCGDSTTSIQSFNGTWQGEISTSFSPPIQLEPGESVSADPLWISFSLTKPADIELYFAWAIANLQGAKQGIETPDAWITVADGDTNSDLQSAIANWIQSGISYALVPGTWEGRPGSLEGATPDWPRDMKSVASNIRQGKLVPGITVDPLCVDEAKGDWVAASDDGRHWLSPLSEEAKAYGVERMKTVASWGYGFYVVPLSDIPDEILTHFGASRAQANATAYAIMNAAAGGAPVYAASRKTLDSSLDGWLAAAASTCRFHEYGAATGAVRVDGSAMGKLDNPTLAAIALCGAPIEVMGSPSRSTVADFSRVFPKPNLWARAIDVEAQAPKLWQVQILKGEGTVESLAIVSFDGARPHEAQDLSSMNGQTVQAWQCSAADFVDAMRKAVPENAKLTSNQ